MQTATFVVTTVVAGFAFGLALLWLIAEWLKADEEAEARERDLREMVEKMRTGMREELRSKGGPDYDLEAVVGKNPPGSR